MRKFFIALLVLCGALVAVSCHKEEPVQEMSYYDYLIADYNALVAAYPDAKDNFVEARYVLNGVISETAPESLKAESVELYCYTFLQGVSEIFVFVRDFETGETQMVHYSADSPWIGDMKIKEEEMVTLKYSLEDAIDNARKDPAAAASDGLDTRYITLRKPLWPVWENPQYVIGGSSGRKYHVFVDSKTGDVKSLETPIEEGSSFEFLLNDYSYMLDQFENNEIMGYRINLQGCFVEARYVLNEPVNSLQASLLFPKEVTYLFYGPKLSKDGKDILAKGWRDMTDGPEVPLALSMDELDSPWTGDRFIDPSFADEIITIEEAINNLKLANVTDPDTKLVNLRWPDVTPALEHLQYEFIGDKTKTVFVDAHTGEVSVAN